MKSTSKVARSKTDGNAKEKAPKALLKVREEKVPKTAAKSKLTIANKTGPHERMKSKMSKVEALHSKRPTPTLAKANKSDSPVPAILSPFRLPIDTDRVAAQAARYGGMTLVTLGSIAALIYAQIVELPISAMTQLGQVCSATDLTCLMRQQMNSLSNTTTQQSENLNDAVTAQQAQLAEEDDEVAQAVTTATQQTQEELREETNEQSSTLNQAATTNTTNLANTTNTTNTINATVNRAPAVFTVGASEPLGGVVPVTITVSDAESVVVSAFYDEWDRNVSLGSARRESGAWVYSWNTRNFEDGRYRLKALIKNSTGTYEQVSSSYVTVNNKAVTEVPVAAEAAVAENDLEASIDAAGANITLAIKYPVVESSDVVRYYLTNDATDVRTFLGNGYVFAQTYIRTNVTVRESFSVVRLPAGEYTAHAERWRNESMIDEATTDVTLPGSRLTPQEPLPTSVNSNAVVTIRGASSLSGFADVFVETNDATFVELYAVNTASVNNIFLGLARKSSTGSWTFNWDTKQIPNSRYQVFARVGSNRGVYESNKVLVTVDNERVSAPTTSQVQELSERTEVYEELMTDTVVVRNNFWNMTNASTTALALDRFIEENKDRIQSEFQKYAAALRSGNESSLATANTRFVGLENEFRDFVTSEPNFDELVGLYNDYIDTAKKRIEADVDKIEKIIDERKDDGLFSDSDWDGITDFDELYIYNTDPFLADTSGNGIPDGVAILNGLDPRSTSLDSSIVYESPQEIGIVRDDLLRVMSITPVEQDARAPEVSTIAPAVIAGTALPNSFVTIFIFSTPVVVTVKTEADGSWQYRFEKELEDGDHSVYVALTDNSGRIIARSSPFRFIKEAQAYTTVDEALEGINEGEAVSNDYSFFSSSIVYLVMSFAVVTIGLVLLLLGMYIDRRRKEELVPAAPLTV